MTRFASLLIIALTALHMLAAPSITEEARQAYAHEDYNRALQLWQQAVKQQGTSTDVYYNMGNAYYKLKDMGHAILCYERALALDPGNRDARYNLEFVRERAAISEDHGSTYFADKLSNVVCRLSSNTWAVWGIITLLLLMGGVALYVFADQLRWRKLGFFGALTMLVLCVLCNVCAHYVYTRSTTHDKAIVMAAPATLSTAPRVPKDTTEVAFTLGVGFKVTILDSVASKSDKWINVRTGDNRKAWINSSDIEII